MEDKYRAQAFEALDEESKNAIVAKGASVTSPRYEASQSQRRHAINKQTTCCFSAEP